MCVCVYVCGGGGEGAARNTLNKAAQKRNMFHMIRGPPTEAQLLTGGHLWASCSREEQRGGWDGGQQQQLDVNQVWSCRLTSIWQSRRNEPVCQELSTSTRRRQFAPDVQTEQPVIA